MRWRYLLLCSLGVTAGLTFSAIAQERANSATSSSAAAPAPTRAAGAAPAAKPSSASAATAEDAAAVERALRVEGEKRFRTNCGRCHMTPHKFPPRVMATAIRHMRVRATITEEDMRLILRYMTQ
jgi:mono/diheme cytochrome c family protein